MSHENDCIHVISHTGRGKLQTRADALLRHVIAAGKTKGVERGYFFASVTGEEVTIIDCSFGFVRLFGYDSIATLLDLPHGMKDIVPVDEGAENSVFYEELQKVSGSLQDSLGRDTFFLSARKKDQRQIHIVLTAGMGVPKQSYRRLLDLPEFGDKGLESLFTHGLLFGGMTFPIHETSLTQRLTLVN
tara:strand:- start:5485 stop:6048 length:564 start_codon:yes stop_codon:yes gene_type:complete